MSYADRYVALAERLIREKGKPITVHREVPATFDPVTLEGEPAAAMEYQTFGVFLPPGSSHLVKMGTVEQRVDWRILIAGSATPWPVQPNDRILDGPTRHYTVVTSEQIAPEGTPILYDALVQT